MTKKNKTELAVIIIGAVLLDGAIVIEHFFGYLPEYVKLGAFILSYAVLGLEVIVDAVRGIIGGELLDENFLMSAASIGAFIIGERTEAVLVMLLYRIGELLQSIAVGKSRDSVEKLINICPESVELETADGVVTTAPEEVHIGDVFIVRPGERIPIDGTVIEGSSSLNTAALTGESLPQDVGVGYSVCSGCINMSGMLRVRSGCEHEDSTVRRMLELIEGAAANKSQSEKFITKFARWYTPIVVGLAVLLAVLPPLLLGGEWKDWIYRALNFLVISCPCALVISVPLTFFGGIGGASRRGILAKGSNCLESLAKCGTAVFDKTGTLTKGVFRIVSVDPANGFSPEQLLTLTACAEQHSTHPLAACVKEAYSERAGAEALPIITDVTEKPGYGIRCVSDGRILLAGNMRLMNENGIDASFAGDTAGTAIYTAVDGIFAGSILIGDEVKDDATETINALRNDLGIKTVMLTGDRDRIGQKIATELSLDDVRTELLPEDKVAEVERIIRENRKHGTVAYVGDGINDAPVIARADIGFAMGGLGSDAAIEAADVVLMDDRISKTALAVRIAKRTVRIAKENIVFALGVKLLVLALGALGYAELWMAIAADVGVCLIAVLNAMRSMRVPEK